MQIGFLGLLTLLLVGAKLFGFAGYSWFIAFLPVIVPLFILGLVMCFFLTAIVFGK